MGLLPAKAAEARSCCTASSPVSLRLPQGFLPPRLTFARALMCIVISKVDFGVSPGLLEKSWQVLLRKHFTLLYFCPWFSKRQVKRWELLGADPHLPISRHPSDMVGPVICCTEPSAEPPHSHMRKVNKTALHEPITP